MEETINEILEEKVVLSREKSNQRAVKRKIKTWSIKNIRTNIKINAKNFNILLLSEQYFRINPNFS